MPINFAWIIALVGGLIALFVWARTKRVGPAVTVFVGGLIIMIMADPSTLTTLAGQGRDLLQRVLDSTLE